MAENLLLNHSYPMIYGLFINWNKLYLLAKNALSELGINHINTRFKCAQLSSGDQMLVRIASCLVKDKHSIPSLYVFDEPTAALTIQESEKLFKAIENLKKKKNVIFDIDWQGAEQIKKKKLEYKLITFFVLPPSREVLFSRL